MVKILKTWGEKKNATPGQISLAWLLHQKPFIVPIPGTTQMPHMLENTNSEKVKFTSDEWREFNNEINKIQIVGERLPVAVQQYSDVEAPLKK
ncbi:putative oxidoreductase YdbC [compost metagenome]